MNLTDLYISNGIEGMPLEILERILDDKYEKVSIKKSLTGALITSDNILIKCVSNYYDNSSMEQQNNSGTNACYSTQTKLGIDGVRSYNCLSCHKQCISLLKQRKINRI